MAGSGTVRAIVAGAAVLVAGAGAVVSEAEKITDTICHDDSQAAYNSGMTDQLHATIEQTARLSAARVALQCYRTSSGTRTAARKCDAVLKAEETAALEAVELLRKKP